VFSVGSRAVDTKDMLSPNASAAAPKAIRMEGSMRRSDERDELIGRIYEAGVDRRTWPLVADRSADLMGAVVTYPSSMRRGMS
jgi:hypothetical protein